ncbi:MAG: serine/threonine protein kinase [Bacteroidales bacterium]|nr:serine/threonine protein kinase [Bacteroidales bacterium]
MNVETDIDTSGIFSPLHSADEGDGFYNYVELSNKGYNRIFKAQRNGKWYILKGLRTDVADRSQYQDLLAKEFDLMSQFDHPNIVRTLFFENDAVVGKSILMEYIDGVSLVEFQKSQHSAKEYEKIVNQILDALSYVHSKQIIHRDLKPDNILITNNGNNVKIIDFGLSDSDNYTTLKQPAGSLSYIAPEQLAGNVPLDCRADIYSFGKILEMLPLPRFYKRIARKCVRESRDERYRSADEIFRAINFGVAMRRGMVVISCAIIVAVLFLLLIFNKISFFERQIESIQEVQKNQNEQIVLLARQHEIAGEKGLCFSLVDSIFSVSSTQDSLVVRLKRNRAKLGFPKKALFRSYADTVTPKKSFYKVGFVLEALDWQDSVIYVSQPSQMVDMSVDSLMNLAEGDVFSVSWNIDAERLKNAKQIRIRFVYQYEKVKNARVESYLKTMESIAVSMENIVDRYVNEGTSYSLQKDCFALQEAVNDLQRFNVSDDEFDEEQFRKMNILLKRIEQNNQRIRLIQNLSY